MRNILYYDKQNRYSNIGLMRMKLSYPDIIIREYKGVDGLLKIKEATVFLDTSLNVNFTQNQLLTLINNGVMFNFIDFKDLINTQKDEFFNEFDIKETPENTEKYLQLEERFKYLYGDYPEEVRHSRIKLQQELGGYAGRKKGTKVDTKLSIQAKETIINKSKAFKGNMNDTELIKELNINKKTFYKYKKELKNDN